MRIEKSIKNVESESTEETSFDEDIFIYLLGDYIYQNLNVNIHGDPDVFKLFLGSYYFEYLTQNML